MLHDGSLRRECGEVYVSGGGSDSSVCDCRGRCVKLLSTSELSLLRCLE